MKTKIIVLGTIIVGLAIGFWSYSKATDNEISICVKKNGSVFVIDDGSKKDKCKEQDTVLTWNIVGQKGEKGDKGNTGDVGQTGLQGLQGEPGVNGIDGVPGIQGLQGEQGIQGEAGISGVSGWERILGITVNNGDGSKTSTATCSEGKKVIGGGYSQITNYVLNVRANYPSSENQWTVVVDGSNSIIINSYAICITAN